MKIRVIKKKLKNQKKIPLTLKEKRLFLKSLKYSISIRNTVINGMIKQGNFSSAVKLLWTFDKKYQSSQWTLLKENR